MRKRRRGHRLRFDGPGRIRIKLAELIEKALGCKCDPGDIWSNNYPAAKYLDLARWGCVCEFGDHGVTKNVHSWDTMSRCVREGITVVCDDPVSVEVCGKGR